MVLVQEALGGRLWRPRDVAPEPGAVTGPPEGIALAVLLGEHQQDLRRQKGRDAWVRLTSCFYLCNRNGLLSGLHIDHSDRTLSRAAAAIKSADTDV